MRSELLFSIAARDAHPDVGGDREEWDELLSAIEEARNAHAGGSR